MGSLSQFQKLTCRGGVLSRGWGPLPPAVGTSGGPGKALPAPFSPGAPQDSQSRPPPHSGTPASHRGQRDVRGRSEYDFKVDSQLSWASLGLTFIVGGGHLGVMGRRANPVGSDRPRPLPALDVGATVMSCRRRTSGGRVVRDLRAALGVEGYPNTTPDPTKGAPAHMETLCTC